MLYNYYSKEHYWVLQNLSILFKITLSNITKFTLKGTLNASTISEKEIKFLSVTWIYMGITK